MQWQQLSTTFAAPLWFMLTRTNNVFTGYVSTNGVAWIPVGTNTIPIATNYYAGLAVCSRTTSTLDVSTFDNVTTTPWSSPSPDTPTGLAGIAGDSQATLTWNASTNADIYNLKRSTNNGGPYAVIGSGLTVPAFTDTGLADGTKYYYVVSSVNPVGESANSSQISVQPVSSSPPVIGFVTGAGQIQLDWPADHLGWKLQMQTNSLNVGLGTNWVSISGSQNITSTNITINPASGSVFYRLTYP
jgi:hypothetical protein